MKTESRSSKIKRTLRGFFSACQKLVNLADFVWHLANMINFGTIWQILFRMLAKIERLNTQAFELGAAQKCLNIVDLEKCCKLNAHFQKSASIQPRMRPPKLCFCIYISPYFGIQTSHIRVLSCRPVKHQMRTSRMYSVTATISSDLVRAAAGHGPFTATTILIEDSFSKVK